MNEQENMELQSSWTEIEPGTKSLCPYLVETVLVPEDTTYWLCHPDGTREQSRLTFAVFARQGSDDWEDNPMLGRILVEVLGDQGDTRPCPAIHLGVSPNSFVRKIGEDTTSVIFCFKWPYGSVEVPQGEETEDGIRLLKSRFDNEQTVAVHLTPDEGEPFTLSLRLPARGFQLLNGDEKIQSGEVTINRDDLKTYRYRFMGTPEDDRFTISINGSHRNLLCIWHDDGLLTLRDHKDGLAEVGAIPSKGSLSTLMMRGDDVLVKYHNQRWHITIKGVEHAEEDLPECEPVALARHAFKSYEESNEEERAELPRTLMSLEEALHFQWFWMTEDDWSYEHLGEMLGIGDTAADPQKMMRKALIYDNFCALMRRLRTLSYKKEASIPGDQLQARNNKRKIARCVRRLQAHNDGAESIWTLDEEDRKENIRLFRLFRREFINELEEKQ